MTKILTLVSVLFLALVILVSPAFAEDEVRKLVVDLKAKGFTQSEWKENLEKDNILFGPGDKFQVQLTINNAGNRNQTWIKLTQVLPSTVTSDLASNFQIPQIAAGQSYVKNITLTVKGKSDIYKDIKSGTYRIDAKSEVGTQSGDFTVFYTNNGTKSTSTSSTVNLPDTGSVSTLLFGTLIASLLGVGSLALRRVARGY